MQTFLSNLTCTFARPDFIAAAERGNFKLYTSARGAAENTGGELKAVHPVIRTNPVTGWKSLYPVGQHCQFVNGVTEEESGMLLEWFKRLLKENHDLQVRFRWEGVNDIAIWDNRCTSFFPFLFLHVEGEVIVEANFLGRATGTFHCATFDFMGLGDRSGNRAVGCGERPFYDPESTGRLEALEREGNEFGRWFMIR